MVLLCREEAETKKRASEEGKEMAVRMNSRA